MFLNIHTPNSIPNRTLSGGYASLVRTSFLDFLALPQQTRYSVNTIDWFEDFAGVIGVLVRISLATYLFYVCVAAPSVFLTHISVRYLQSEITVLQKVAKELADQRAARLKEGSDTSISIPTSREETMRRNARQAKLDYEFECDLLKRANLDEDELEYALAEAKQKYMHRLRNAIL